MKDSFRGEGQLSSPRANDRAEPGGSNSSRTSLRRHALTARAPRKSPRRRWLEHMASDLAGGASARAIAVARHLLHDLA
jgi:hypothetical protein